MSLKAKVANKPVIDGDGFATGTITNVIELDERIEKQGKKEVRFAAQFEFIIQSAGTQKNITYRFWTGLQLNNEKFGEDELDYNRFTRLCLQLGLVSESDLNDFNNLEAPDIESVEGTKIRFRLEKSRKNQGLHIIDIKSIEVVQ